MLSATISKDCYNFIMCAYYLWFQGAFIVNTYSRASEVWTDPITATTDYSQCFKCTFIPVFNAKSR